MKKAVYIGYFGKENDKYNSPIYEYEYKGFRYTVVDHRNGYSETMKQQHDYEQNRIDSIITIRNSGQVENCKPADINEIYKMMGWDD
jgi:hypothetical protein